MDCIGFRIVVAFGLLLSCLLWAADGHCVELRELSFEFRKYPGQTYFAELPGENIREEIALVSNVKLGSCFYWWNRVHGSSTDSQYRWIGLNFALGCDLGSVDLFYEHHSQHALDMTRPEHFPVSDALGVRWRIFRAS